MTAKQACAKAKVALGGPVKLAEALSRLDKKSAISSQAISQWELVPPTRVLGVEKVTGISRHDLRPDIYPLELRKIGDAAA